MLFVMLWVSFSSSHLWIVDVRGEEGRADSLV